MDDFYNKFDSINVCTLANDNVNELCKIIGGVRTDRSCKWSAISTYGHWDSKCGMEVDDMTGYRFFCSKSYFFYMKT